MLDVSLGIPLLSANWYWMIPLGFPYYRLINIGWFPCLKIERFIGFKDVLCFQNIFGTYYQNSISCFLIDVKFISKLCSILLMENLSLSDPHLYKNISRIRYSEFIDNKKYSTSQKEHGTMACNSSNISENMFPIFTKIIFPRMFP